MKLRTLIIIAILFFIVALALNTPASWVYKQIEGKTPLQLDDIDGTLWEGSARALITPPNPKATPLYIPHVRWNFTPITLLTGRIGYDAEVNLEYAELTTHFAASPLGALYFSNLKTAINIEDLPLPSKPPLTGMVEVNLDSAIMDQGRFSELEGILKIKDSVFTLGQAAPLGDYEVNLSTENGRINAKVRDVKASLGVSGTLKVEQPSVPKEGKPAKVKTDISVSPKGETPESVRTGLSLLGKPAGPNGSIRISQQLDVPML